MIDLNPTGSDSLHVVLGAGQIGRRLARLLAEAGYRVRLVRRGAPGGALAGVTWMQGDITDPAFADRALDGAAVVYNCTNPPEYHRWDGVLQPLFRAVREAATRAGARLVVLDNLYMYGHADGRALREDHPMRPVSGKGELRKELAVELLRAHERGELEVAIGRAADFFGPDTGQSVFGDRLRDALVSDKAIEVFGDPELPRSYSYAPDVAVGLAVLGTQEGTTGRVWHLPVSSQGTTSQFLEAMGDAFGRPVKTRRMPRWAVKAVGVFVPVIGAMVEMLYQWEEPYVVDDSDFRTTFGVVPTPLADAARETVAAWRASTADAA